MTLWDVASGDLIREFDKGEEAGWDYRAWAFSPDGKLAPTGGADATVRLWDVTTGKVVRTFLGKGAESTVHALAFSPDGKRAVSAGDGQILKLWDVATGRRIRSLELPQDQAFGYRR